VADAVIEAQVVSSAAVRDSFLFSPLLSPPSTACHTLGRIIVPLAGHDLCIRANACAHVPSADDVLRTQWTIKLT